MDCKAVYTRTNEIIREAKKVWARAADLDSTNALRALEVIELHVQALRAELTPQNLASIFKSLPDPTLYYEFDPGAVEQQVGEIHAIQFSDGSSYYTNPTTGITWTHRGK